MQLFGCKYRAAKLNTQLFGCFLFRPDSYGNSGQQFIYVTLLNTVYLNTASNSNRSIASAASG